MNKSTLILGLAFLGVLAVVSSAFGFMGSFGPNGFARMGGYGMMGGFANQSVNFQSIDSEQALTAMDTSLENAVVDKNGSTITFDGETANITLLGGPEYADEKFVAAGLVNPTIKVSKGAKVSLKLINEDEGMPHGIEVVASPPPYAYMSMMQGPIYPGAYVPVIAQAKDGMYPVASASFVASQSGTYYYICQVPGHATNGMYGELIIQ